MEIICRNKLKLLLSVVVLFYVFSAFVSCSGNRSEGSKNREVKENSWEVVISGSGMDSVKLSEIPVVMKQFVDAQKISGAVTLVARNGHITSFEATGFRDLIQNLPMEKNTLFRIASMTKPFSAAAIMMLSEEGKLQLDDPVENYLPEFRNLWMVSEKSSEKMLLVQPSRKITIRDILTHTSGLAALPGPVKVKSISEYVHVISQLPLQFEPGTEWRYGGSGITAAARIVEVLSGMPFEEFLKNQIFIPLGMNSTYFAVPEGEAKRLATIYHPSADSVLIPAEVPDWYSFPRPEAGLVSTASDMACWMLALLGKGMYNGTRILREESVAEMTKIQTGELHAGFTEGMSFGLGLGIVREPQGVTAMLSKGTFGHGGAFGTQYWADPATNTLYILMIQRQGFGNGDASEIRNTFQRIAAEAIIE